MIAFHAVSKRFGEQVALDHLCLELPSGATHVLLGSSGCGKSTVLRVVLGLVAPDRGEVRVDGAAVGPATCRALREQMGYVVQEGGLYPHLTVYENVALPAEPRRWPRERVRDRVMALARMVGFDEEILTRYPGQLSGGQRQRAGLIRALVLDPPLLLLDEPLGALDPVVRADLQGQLGRIFGELGKTVLLVTHDLREAMALADSVTLMTDGHVLQHGTFADLTDRPAHPFVTAFLNAQALPRPRLTPRGEA